MPQPPPEDPAIAHLAAPRTSPRSNVQFSLETLLLLTTLVAACLGLMVAVPPLGIPLTVIIALALARTLVECRRFLKDGRPLRFQDKLNSFFGSLGFSFLALVGALLVLGVLAFAALAVAAIAFWILDEVGGEAVATLATSVMGLVLALAVVAAAATTFFAMYWQTLYPRLTIEPPPRGGRRNI